MEEKKKNKILKSNKTLLIIGISLLAIAILLIIIPICLESINKLNPKTLHDLIYNNQDYEGKYAKINKITRRKTK